MSEKKEKPYRISKSNAFRPPKFTLHLKSKTDNTEKSMNIIDVDFFGVMLDFAQEKNKVYEVLEAFITEIEKSNVHNIYTELEVISEIIAKNGLFN